MSAIQDAAHRPCVGLLDSGVGGLTVLQQCLVETPRGRYVYLADEARFPYGQMQDQAISEAVANGARYLEQRGVDLLVLAGDSASALGRHVAQEIFGERGVLDTITALPTALGEPKAVGRVVILTTPAAERSGVHRATLAENGFNDVHVVASDVLAAASQRLASPDELTVNAFRAALAPVHDHRPDTLVVGCTNALLQGHLVRRLMGDVTLVDVRHALADKVRMKVGNDESLRDAVDVALFSSGRPDELQQYARDRLQLSRAVTIVDLDLA